MFDCKYTVNGMKIKGKIEEILHKRRLNVQFVKSILQTKLALTYNL